MTIKLDFYIRDGKVIGECHIGDGYGHSSFEFNFHDIDKVKKVIQKLMVQKLEEHDKDSAETIIAKANADKRTVRVLDEISGNHRVITVYRANGDDSHNLEITSKQYEYWI